MGVLQIHRPDGKPLFVQAGHIESFSPHEQNPNQSDITLMSGRTVHVNEPVDVVARLMEISGNAGFAYAEKLIGTSDWVCENKLVATADGKTQFLRP